jgi:hypothetical protein
MKHTKQRNSNKVSLSKYKTELKSMGLSNRTKRRIFNAWIADCKLEESSFASEIEMGSMA